jgi:hypothetical protein
LKLAVTSIFYRSAGAALVYLDLSYNRIGDAGAERLEVLGQGTALAHLNLSYNYIDTAGAEIQSDRIRWGRESCGSAIQCAALAHLDLSDNDIDQTGQRGLQGCWRSAQRWLTSFSAAITSDQPGQRALQECCRSAQRWLTSTSATIRSGQAGQRDLQECWRSAQRWFSSISAKMRLALSRKTGFELLGVVEHVALF